MRWMLNGGGLECVYRRGDYYLVYLFAKSIIIIYVSLTVRITQQKINVVLIETTTTGVEQQLELRLETFETHHHHLELISSIDLLLWLQRFLFPIEELLFINLYGH